ncbi:uncharacterized protein LOC131929424 [Physella acuta]|uniref:uncharacterized protein LOC131929424 n=1 Tax=Physella acuta TaxID=109671 RepID=UPI0027DC0E7C|nr:uncharacterized protein LOC131929424 [Physella acuta]XP_059141599.1 uncharacterized protein LOC131929424 [Physella acuta]
MAMNEAKDRVLQLESAIKRLDSVKKHLNRNASDIKAKIHASVSRNLECLRVREVSLLSQVDNVLSVKEETLQQQQARLNQALGVLKTGLSMVQEDTASERQLADTLKKLNRVELSPEETPYISFRADHVELRDSIMNYGRVDANGLPLITAFDDPGNPSASLPRHVEEYEDVDHHVFYKTVEEIKRSQCAPASCQINVNIPKLSTRVEDWLQKKLPKAEPESNMKSLPATRPSTLNKAGDAPTVGLSCHSTPGSSCSLNNWLSSIKQHTDLEEEHDFEIIDNSCNQKVFGEINTSKVPAKVTSSVDDNLKVWIHPKSLMSPKFTSDVFKHIPTDNKVWLQHFCNQVTSLEDLKHRDMFAHISKDTSTWLRSRGPCKQQTAARDFFSHIPTDQKFWLKDQNHSNGLKKSELTEKKVGVQEDTAKWLAQPSSALKTGPGQVEVKPVHLPNPAKVSAESLLDSSPAPNPTELLLQEWLYKPSSKSVTKAEEAVENFFKHIPDASNSMWLTKSTQTPSCPPEVSADKDDSNKWLQLKSPKPADVKCVTSDLSDWLMVPNQIPEKLEEEKDEGWSVCSEHTVTSDCYAKDVAVADEYFNKWLL